MKRFLMLLAVGSLAVLGQAQMKPAPSLGIKKFTNCGAAGSAAQVLVNGTYTMTVLEERTTVCFGALCDAGAFVGIDYPSGHGQLLRLNGADGGTPVACQSSGASGDVHFLPMVQ